MKRKIRGKLPPHPKNCWACYQAAIVRHEYGMGRPRNADRIVNRLLKRFPDDYEGNRLKSVIASSLERFREAFRFADRTIRLDPTDPDGPGAKSFAYNQMERWKDAAVWTRRSIRLFEKNSGKWQLYSDIGGHYEDLGSALMALGRKKEALRTFRTGFRLSKRPWVRSFLKDSIKKAMSE